jgi:hypothetical protein
MAIRMGLSAYLAVLSIAMTVGRATATVVLPQNIEQLESQAQWVFVGVCTTRTAVIDERGIPINIFTFRIVEAVKGALKNEGHIEVRQFGNDVPNANGLAMHIAGIPKYAIGEEVVLFLNPPSRIGLTTPVGLWQGVFRVDRDKTGKREIRLDPIQRKLLVAGVNKAKYTATRRLTPDEEMLLSNPPDRVDLSTFCSLVRRIIENREQGEKRR